MHRVGLVLILATACGGKVDLPVDPDALGGGDGGLDALPDASDGGPDAAVDAPPPAPFTGTFSILETEIILAGAPAPYGQGFEARIAFTDNAMVPPPLLEENAGPLGCKVWEYTRAQAAHVDAGLDEGAVFLSFAGGTTPAMAPLVPSCRHVAGAGYLCQDQATFSSGGFIDAGGSLDTAVLTDNDITYAAANSLGRWVRIEGADNPGNNGVFPIVGLQGDHAIVLHNPARVPEILPGSASHINLAGVGAIPGVGDPGFLADDVALTFNHAGVGPHIPSFIVQTAAPGHAGDDFSLDAPSRALITRIPRDGSELTFTCANGCAPDSADGSTVRIVTTDAPVAGLSPVAMPPPTGKRVEIRCSQLGTGTITVPAAYSAKLVTAGATRIEARFIRAANLAFAPPPVSGVVGHALVGITTP
jgi:hypothetical protein